MTSNPFMSRFNQAPALVNPELQLHFEACLTAGAAHIERFEKPIEAISAEAHDNDDGFWPAEDSYTAFYRPYKVLNGTLRIDVKGVLINDFPYQVSDWLTGYEYISRAVNRGLADPDVKRIALMVNSPGGTVAECFECADVIASAREQKPIQGFARDYAYSAAYALISATSNIHMTRTGGVGSIGVVTAHTDISKRMDAMGMKVTFIYAGKHKVDGNPYEPLPEAVKDRMQAQIDELYEVFVSHVARHRTMSEDEVRATEADTFTATEATSNGLADSAGPLEAALASFEAEMSNETESDIMSQDKDTSATLEAAVNTARAEALREGASLERARITAILGCDAAKNRPVAAQNVAMETEMSVEAATNFLAKLPEEATPVASTGGEGAGVGANRFDKAMTSTGNPNLSGNDHGEGSNEPTGAQSLIAARKAATGFGPKKVA
jgi:signal peptide peptidase SppA